MGLEKDFDQQQLLAREDACVAIPEDDGKWCQTGPNAWTRFREESTGKGRRHEYGRVHISSDAGVGLVGAIAKGRAGPDWWI